MRKTKIVCTIGPASDSVEKLVQLMEAGMNVARLNFSHGNHDEQKQRIENIRKAERQTGKTVAILLDTKGPEVRTGKLEGGSIYLEQDQEVTVTTEDVLGDDNTIPVTYAGLVKDVKVGSRILLDDGLIELEVVEKGTTSVQAKVLNNGPLKDRKGVNLPDVRLSLPGITEKDAADILFGINENIDFIAASFVRRSSDVLEIREILETNGGEDIQIIPKVENREGVQNIKEILEVSDGLMVARGDLGVEIPSEDVPIVQKELIEQCNWLGKPVITATQMLDSMQRNPRPTRAEASDVANAIFDGTDAIMLSGETAAGKYPVQSVDMMNKIAMRAEAAIQYEEWLTHSHKSEPTITNAISQSVSRTALSLNASAIITATESGYTARMIAKFRPKAPIVAVTSSVDVVRRLALVWGVTPQLGEEATTTDDMLGTAVTEALNSGIVHRGDLVVITAGVPVGETGTTNLMKVHVIGDVIVKGQGIGHTSVSGKVVKARQATDAEERMEAGDILVTFSTDKEMVPYMEQAGAIITEEGGLTSHAAVVGLSLGVPVVVGAKDAMDLLENDQEVTVDASRGDIYDGQASVL